MLKYDELLFSFAFHFNLRHYVEEQRDERRIARLESELQQTCIKNEALRRQMRAIQHDDASTEATEAQEGERESRVSASSDAAGDVDKLGAEGAADDAAELLKAWGVLRRSTRPTNRVRTSV